MLHDTRWVWSLEWSLIGGFTSLLAPLAATHLMSVDLTAYCWTAAALGTLSGAAIGVFVRSSLHRFPRRSWPALCTVFLPPLLCGWGASVAGVSSLLTLPQTVSLAIPAGGIAALLQVGWIAPFYGLLARRSASRIPLVAVAAGVAPLVGTLTVMTVVGVTIGLGQIL